MKKKDISNFVEQTDRAGLFHRTVQDIRARNADTDPDELHALIDSAVKEVRTERQAKRKGNKA